MTTRIEIIESRLQQTFQPIKCELQDDSARHAGHAGAASGGSHFQLLLVSHLFEGQSRINRHRLVYDCLRDLMHTAIHALEISALAPSELQQTGR